MRRLGMIMALSTLLGMVGGLATGTSALAGRGHKWRALEAGPFTMPAFFCGFKIRVRPVTKEYMKILKLADGSAISLTTGKFKVSFTNLNTGTTITENASGPAKVTVDDADLSVTEVLAGRALNFLLPGEAQRFGLPPLSVTTGKQVVRANVVGDIFSLSLQGHLSVDVCAALS